MCFCSPEKPTEKGATSKKRQATQVAEVPLPSHSHSKDRRRDLRLHGPRVLWQLLLSKARVLKGRNPGIVCHQLQEVTSGGLGWSSRCHGYSLLKLVEYLSKGRQVKGQSQLEIVAETLGSTVTFCDTVGCHFLYHRHFNRNHQSCDGEGARGGCL